MSTIIKREGPSVWCGEDLATDHRWIIPWTTDELEEIDIALCRAQRKSISWKQMDKADFPLVNVADKLAYVADRLEHDLGLIKLTGLPVDQYSLAQLEIIWMGLGMHLGEIRYQDYQGQLMRRICDEGGDLGNRYESLDNQGSEFLSSKARTYGSGSLRFHTDRTDVVGLLTVQQAAKGGLSKIASTEAVHNALLEQRPDLLKLLYQPIYRSRLGEEQGGGRHVYPLPVFGVREGKLTSHYSRTYVEAAQLLPGTPTMTEQQWQALDMLATECEKLCYAMTLNPGDIQLLNNHVVYHARDAFEDDRHSGQQRLLLRLWLSMRNSRSLPEDHAILWGQIEGGKQRGGIGQSSMS